MAITTEKVQDVPMSVRMRRVLATVKRMPAADRLQILVKAGLMTEAEAHQAVDLMVTTKITRRRTKSRKSAAVKSVAKPKA